MTACNFRSLLLAAIVLSNCITWTASRHQYTHNVHQHRTRHRRQGAGLYLSASYVIPGGEGGGAWGEWGEVSPCSRTCGGGVASQKRICLQIGPDGRPQCSGGDTKYFSCQTQDCPVGSGNFRAEQCAEFDDKDFRGFKYKWVPYTKAPNPCELNCMPHGERFYFRHKSKVIDGTRCNDESFDVCVSGTCQPVGCDMMLGSNAREDKCRECRGNGANCHTTGGIFDSQDLVKGYNDILLIPAGSTTIVIEEIEPSNNYLALRAKNGTYYLNGHYHIDFPRSIMIAGALWYYERSQQGFAAPDKLRCLGPINEPLYLSLLLQEENVGIKYEYSVPNTSAPPTDKRYNWVHEEFTPCSTTCGGGFQTRNVTCRSREELEIVDDGLCDGGLKPPTNQSCNPDPCPAQWVEGPWGECSKRCGSGGVKSREVNCQKIIANGYSSVVADKECFDLLGPKPELFQKCNEGAPCPTWFIGKWKPCDKLCDEGKQMRQVTCYQKNNGRIEVLDDEDCTEEKPGTEQSCMLEPCDGVDWVTSDWSGCDTCLSENRTRLVVCTTKDRRVMNETFCSYHTRPVDQEACDKDKLPPCQVQWYATQWSKCSVDCGDGVQTRKVFCGMFDGENVSIEDDSKCADLPKYNETKPCTVPKDKCPAKWFAAPWGACTKECGGGEQNRRVMCFQGDKEVSTCDGNTVLDSTQLCNLGPCDRDETIPVNSSSTPITDEEECDYDTDYPEMGLDVDSTGTTLDRMMSDAPSSGYAEVESTLSTETGSGFGSTLTTDEMTTFDGSGFSSLSTEGTTDSTFTVGTDYTTDDSNTTGTETDSTVSDLTSTDTTGTRETETTNYTVTDETRTTTADTGSTVEETNSTLTSDTGSTEATISSGTSETGPSGSTESTASEETSSTGTGETSSTSSGKTGETYTTPSGETGVTSTVIGTEETGSTETGETGSSGTGETGSTGTSETGSTGTVETGSTSTEKTGSTGTSETGSTATGETGSTATGETGSTGTDETGSTSTEKTGSTGTSETGSTATGETGSTGTVETGSTTTEKTGSTGTGETSSTGTGETGSTATGETGSTGTDETGSTSTEKTGSTGTGETSSTGTGETGSTATDESGSTGTGETESTESSVSTTVEETNSTAEARSSASTSKIRSTIPSSETRSTTPTSETRSTNTEETNSTGTGTEETGSTESTITEGTNSTESTVTEETNSTESTVTEETSSTESTVTEETSSTDSTITEKTESTVTEKTESTVTEKTESTVTEKTESTVTGKTESTVTEETGSTQTETTDTGLTDTGSTDTNSTETGSTETSSTDTGSTEKGSTDTGSTEKGSTYTGSTVTGSTDAGPTDAGPTDTGSTETGSTDTGSTEKGSTDTGSTNTGSTESGSTNTGSTDTAKTTSIDSTEEAGTTPSGSTGTDKTTGSKGRSRTTSGGYDETVKTTSALSTEESTGSTATEESSTGLSTESSASSETTEPSTGSSESIIETITSSGESESTTESGSTVSTSKSSRRTTIESETSESRSTTVSGTFGAESSTIESSTSPESTETTELGSTVSSVLSKRTSIESSTSESRSTTVSGTSGSESSTIESSISPESTETTELGSTVSSVSSSEVTGTSTLGSESSSNVVTETNTAAESESTVETTESSTSISSESSTSESGSSTDGSSTVSDGSTETEITSTGGTGSISIESTTESGSTDASMGTKESTTLAFSTTEGTTETGSTEVSGSTTEGLSTTEGTTGGFTTASSGSTPWVITTTMGRKRPLCKVRRKPKCADTEFGCCPDKKTAAGGPFDEGCPKPRTCKESTYGCCADGLSPAQGDNKEGCPIEPCADTLFGCCLSDNKTAAQGNDQDECPPPPPLCASSNYGCCADNETEAKGPEKEGCPESETTTTGAETETTTTGAETETTEESSEPSSTSEGTTDISTTLDTCANSKFGCCPDNETEAIAPGGEGCPCNTTEFGCCPDDVSPAQGNDQAGCPGPCSTSQHGCCQDNKTPAHGPDFEGCCLLQAFGCCPDNRNPARGPHLEGCGCQYARHGCCPDNVTIAQGPENQGCGCQYTTHGCCPDRHTGASGPNNEGCACNTYQFGCCADGVTIAKGPDQQGCHCRDSKYGCCGDGETLATGPSAAGCDCSTSKYGCCPDGHTEATGSKFLGCTDAPENKQAVCSMSTDPGPCHNFTAMWFYDLVYGGCSRFWYGGCEGNGNRFATKEDCEDVCANPAPKDACKLPSVKGPCDDDNIRWHYNSSREQCIPFRYGGCLGNSNNFFTQQLCQAQCEPGKTEGQCNLPIEQGSCAGNYSRWGFNAESHRCEQFIWGGCEGNSNRFSTEAACTMRCNPPGALPAQCTKPQEAGSCSEKEALWSFSQSENRCVPFYYSGCEGNDNRFDSRETCEQTCPSAYVPDKCTLPAETGACSNYRQRWFYDTSIKRCRLFYFGGCGGNENNFDSEAECESSCSELVPTSTTVRPTEPQPLPQPRPQQPEQEPSRPDLCFLAIDAGPCTNTETRYAFDTALGRCTSFTYGGCGGNQNNFPDDYYCSHYCPPMQDVCQLPMVSGPCEESLTRWFYNPETDSCSQFAYGGCEGNDNRFESPEACERRCRTGPAQTTRSTTTTTLRTTTTTVAIDSRFAEEVPTECSVPESLEQCQYSGEVWYFEQARHECVPHSNQEAGAVCRHSGTFTSQEACERSCGAFRGVDVCQQRVDPGPCQTYVTKVYFDAESGQCREFAYGGCLGGANRFSTLEECSQVCKAEIDPCTLPPEQGTCFSYIQQWYFDSSRGQCNEFVYTGCGGNENRFESRQDCESRCKRPEATTTTTTVAPLAPQQKPVDSECITPRLLAPCGENVTAFYYDSERRQCVGSFIGGCGLANSYSTEEECERRCGEFREKDVCGARLDPGPCRASIPKFYWDSMTGRCQPYAYGGCDGGPNRFSTEEECENVCGATGPAPECLQEVDTGESCEAVQARRWHYSVAHGDCVAFIYQGCGGNYNNFHSYAQCTEVCRLSTGGEGPNEVLPRECDGYRQECEALVCQFGIQKITEEDCQRCLCKEDPCVRANCSSSQRCEPVAIRNPDTIEPQYSARCVDVYETNEVVPDCEQYAAECARLQCEYGLQRARAAGGCERCACVQLEIDCAPLRDECQRLKCNYGMERSYGTDGCERCKCKEHPCAGVSCAAGERCVLTAYRDGVDQEPKYAGDCRPIVKPGACPVDETTSNEVTCRRECHDDADCRGVGKCCRRGCSDLCLAPAEPTTSTAHPLFTTTYAPNLPAPPQAIRQQEPEVAAEEGGTATLRCLFHGNPPPKITWRRGELTIDGNVGRYKLSSDGSLQIVSLYRNDTGVYICVADNGLGVARQEIHLVVNDPVKTPVGIAGDENAVVTGELNKPLSVRCLAYGYPQPTVFWYHGLEGSMVPFNDAVYEARGNVLLIRSLSIETLGEYTCQAYNGQGKAASWVVAIQAYRPEGIFLEHEFVVPRYTVAPMAKTQPPTSRTTTTTTTTTTEAPIPLFTVPVSTHVSTQHSTLNIGGELRISCEVDGFPDPDVYWTKDGARIESDDRVSITGRTLVSRLTVSRVAVSDSGLYACHASNPYSSHSDTAQINVQQLVVPVKCTDNPFFANCDLIVRSNFCRHKYYSKFCCKSCVEAGQLDPQEAELQADQPFRRK